MASSAKIDTQVDQTGGSTDFLGLSFMGYNNNMLDQASMNNSNWSLIDKFLSQQGISSIDCGTWDTI